MYFGTAFCFSSCANSSVLFVYLSDSAVGVILPPTIDATQRAHFLSILNSLTAFREERTVSLPSKSYIVDTSGGESFSDTLSRGIVTGMYF